MQDRFMFRAWNKEAKTMHYSAEETYNGIFGKPKIEHTSFSGLLNDNQYIIMQCTGLKDKTGKLIYEGDIVKLSGNDNPYMNNLIGVVKYSQEYAIFFINIPNNIAWYEFCEVNKKELKIIGNTYQTPELLKEK